jgi:mono/diheme cytochrome c family protein
VTTKRAGQWTAPTMAFALLSVVVLTAALAAPREAHAGFLSRWSCWTGCLKGHCCDGEGPPTDDIGGTWYWVRSPDEEKRVVMGLFNRYCIRCHAPDGRGSWDIPGIPNFTDPRWQASRSDGQIARIILEGRGAVMPPFRGAISLEEAYGLARYLRTFIPGTETPRPAMSLGGQPAK